MTPLTNKLNPPRYFGTSVLFRAPPIGLSRCMVLPALRSVRSCYRSGPARGPAHTRSPIPMTSNHSLPDPHPPHEERAHRGQILIMFAFMLVALLGALGLSVDLGMAFSQRRTMQSAADAGAYAGAWAVLKSKAVQTEVNTVVNQNTMNFGTITSIQCEYINDARQSLGG